MTDGSGKKGGSGGLYGAAYLGSGLRGDFDEMTLGPVDDFARLVDEDDPLNLLSYLKNAYDRHHPTKNFEDTRIYREKLRRLSNRTASRAFEEDNHTRIQGIVGHIDHDDASDVALMRLVDYLRKPAFFGYFMGSMGSGKTHAMLYIADLWRRWVDVRSRRVHDGQLVLTNVEMRDPDLYISSTSNVEVLVDGESRAPKDLVEVDREQHYVFLQIDGEQINPLDLSLVRVERENHLRAVLAAYPGESFFALDEWHQDTNEGADRMIEFVKEMRHKPWIARGAVTGHTDTDFERQLREVVTAAFEKPSQRRMRVYDSLTSNGPEDHVFDEPDVPKHSLDNYDDEGDVTWIFDAETDDADNEDGGDGVDDEQLDNYAQGLRDAGLTLEEITTKLEETHDEDWSTSKVSRRTTNPAD